MKRENFTKKIFFRLWWPELISAVSLAIADMADALVLGQRMQSVGLAAISLCLPIYMIINVVMHSLGLGGSTYFSRYMGEGRNDDARRCFRSTLYTALGIGAILAVSGNLLIDPFMAVLGTVPADGEIFFTAREYARVIIAGIPLFFLNYILNYFLRNNNHQKMAAMGFSAANILDFVMNIVFVFVLDMGAFGAALSTVIAQAAAVIIYLPGILEKNGVLRPGRSALHFDQVFRYFKNGASLSVQYVLEMIFLLIMNRVLMRDIGEDGVAVFEIIQNISFLFLYVFGASAKAMQPLLSTYCGECNEQEVRSTRRLGMTAGLISGLMFVAYIFAFPAHACWLFGLRDSAVFLLARGAIRIYCVGAVFIGYSTLLENYSQACDMEKNAFALTLLRGSVILLPMTVLFASLGGGDYIWWIFPATEIVSLAVYALWYKRRGEDLHISHHRKFTYEIENSSENISGLSQTVADACESWSIPAKTKYFSGMAAEEICGAIKERNKNAAEMVFIQVTLVARTDDTVELHLRDNGVDFNPLELNSGKVGEDDFDEDGLGMQIIKDRAKGYTYRHYQGFNTLVVKV